MTFASDVAVSNLQAGAANLVSDIMRSVVDPQARAEALALLAKALAAAIGGTVAKGKPAKRFNA